MVFPLSFTNITPNPKIFLNNDYDDKKVNRETETVVTI